jgi:hypothetical protein
MSGAGTCSAQHLGFLRNNCRAAVYRSASKSSDSLFNSCHLDRQRLQLCTGTRAVPNAGGLNINR